ncbi:MAG: hypothetical protein PHX53_10725 [Syntrophales bacterium]|nr:hypothetical protein [Syntrophales bacterium]
MVFDNYKQAKTHILQYMKVDTLCRQKLIGLFKWLYYSTWEYKVKSSSVNDSIITFSFISPGENHFLRIRYGKKCAELYFYKLSPIKDYMKVINKNWVKINGKDIDSLPINDIKDYIKLSCRNRVEYLKRWNDNLIENNEKDNNEGKEIEDTANSSKPLTFVGCVILSLLLAAICSIIYIGCSMIPRSFFEAIPGLIILILILCIIWAAFKAWLDWIIP